MGSIKASFQQIPTSWTLIESNLHATWHADVLHADICEARLQKLEGMVQVGIQEVHYGLTQLKASEPMY